MPRVREMLLAVTLTAAAEIEVAFRRGGDAAAAVAAIAFIVLAWRRRAPLLVALAVTSAIVIQAAVGGTLLRGSVPLAAVAVAVASVGARLDRSDRGSVAAAVAAPVAVVLALAAANQLDSSTTSSFLNDIVFYALIVGACVALGAAMAARRDQISLLEERTARMVREEAQAVDLVRLEERARLGHAVEAAVAQRIGEIALQAAGAERVSDRDPESALAAVVVIEESAREALDALRDVIGVLRRPEARPA